MRLLRVIGMVMGGAVVVFAMALGVIYAASSRRLGRAVRLPARDVTLAADSATIARGAHLARALGKCVDCHGDDLGGMVMVDDPAFGRFAAPNLTRGRGGLPASFATSDFERAVRHGVARDGRPLLAMPSEAYQYLDDADVAALLSYIRQLPPVDRELAPSTLGPVGRTLLVLDKLPVLAAEIVQHDSIPYRTPSVGPTVAYGFHLARSTGCITCHGETLQGGKVAAGPPDAPPAADISPTGPSASWTEAEFIGALRTGIRPNGTPINAFMPTKLTREMTDVELQAVYAWLQSRKPKVTARR